MIKKWGLSAAALLLTAAVILPGCGQNDKSAKEALQPAVSKVAEMSSYEMKSKLVINDLTIDVPTGEAAAGMGASATQAMSMMRGAEISVDGVYQAEPMQTEATLVLNLKGDMAMTFTIPMVMTKEKIYVKVPNIPMLPIPQTLIGKFIELDLKELAEQSGTEFNPEVLDTQKAQKLSNEIMGTLLGEYDAEKYFNNIKPKDANLPEGVKAEQVVQFQVTNENVKEAITILINNALPKIIDVLGKEEYKELLQIDQADLDQAKEELQTGTSREELDKALVDLDKYLTVNQFYINTAIDKDEFPVYQDFMMDIKATPEDEGSVALSITGSNQYSNINKKPEFKIGIPTGDNVVTLEELQQEFGGSAAY
ncbi:hypothetical protein [Paenibacillus donghaensis]|uniref:Lipoprotein n=1 Tax=Paenibacillus donghaensis TaxID=414771 RepID=A0A2Z2KV59_9BACL|nr:hypothetical protein [Paenibacillus donghaensis]ASA25071.1 hypothetical protein B9T62_32560 [Paenibacillus donghaensis]